MQVSFAPVCSGKRKYFLERDKKNAFPINKNLFGTLNVRQTVEGLQTN